MDALQQCTNPCMNDVRTCCILDVDVHADVHVKVHVDLQAHVDVDVDANAYLHLYVYAYVHVPSTRLTSHRFQHYSKLRATTCRLLEAKYENVLQCS